MAFLHNLLVSMVLFGKSTMIKNLSTDAMLPGTSSVSDAAQAFLRNSTRLAGLKQKPLLAVVVLSLTLPSASFASTCSTGDLTTSTQCLDNVSSGQGGNVTEEMMNEYNSGAGAFALQNWFLIDNIGSFNQTDSFNGQGQDSSNSVFTFTSSDNGNTGTWTLSEGLSFAPEGSYAFVLKGGPGSATYLMDITAKNGIWNVQGIDSKQLSNVKLFGTTSVVPLPAAAWLFGSALIGIAGIGARRRVRRG